VAETPRFEWDYLQKQVNFFENEMSFPELQAVFRDLLSENALRYSSYNVFCQSHKIEAAEMDVEMQSKAEAGEPLSTDFYESQTPEAQKLL